MNAVKKGLASGKRMPRMTWWQKMWRRTLVWSQRRDQQLVLWLKLSGGFPSAAAVGMN